MLTKRLISDGKLIFSSHLEAFPGLLFLKGVPKAFFHHSGERLLIICTATYVFSNPSSKTVNTQSTYVRFFCGVPILFWLSCFGVELNTLLIGLSMSLEPSAK
jgi:hypothetical protein